MSKEYELLKRKLKREEAARKEAESLLEQKSRELYNSNENLKALNSNLKSLVEKRTKALHEKELQYAIMVESSNDMILRLDMTGKIVFANRAVDQLIGFGKKTLTGHNVLEFIDKEKRKQIFIHFARQFLKHNCVNYYDVQVYSKHKQKIWLRLTVQFSSSNCKSCERKQQAFAIFNEPLVAGNDCDFNEIIIVGYDITQQQLDQTRLEKSEKRFRELTESLPELICEVDTDGIVTYANKYAIDKFGYRPEEVLNGKFHINQIFCKSEHKQIATNFARIIRYRKSVPKEYLAKKSNGETFPVIVYTSVIIEHEKVVGIRGVMFDITIRKKQELEIAQNLQQQKFLSKISMLYNSIANFDNNTNQALRLIGKHLNVSRVYIFKDSDDGEYTSNIFEWCSQGIAPQIKELQNIPYSTITSWKKLLAEEGIIYSSNIQELPQDVAEILEPQGIKSILVLPLQQRKKQIGFIGFDECATNRSWSESEIELLRTISNIILQSYLRQETQNELIESEKENRIIIESIPDIIIQANKSGEIKAFKASQNTNLSNLIKNEDSWTISEAFNEKISELLLHAIAQCLKEEESHIEFKGLTLGELQYYEARLVKLDETEVMIIVRDVTVIRQHEVQLEVAKNQAEEASQMKSEFLANVSHEVRTPLNAILGFSQWLFDNTTETLHKSYLRTILKSGKGLLEVINDILDISRIESDSIQMDMHVMRYKDVMSDINAVFGTKAQEKGLNFEIITESSVPGFIIMDEIRFYQIVYNLVNNALKFTKKGFVKVTSMATETSVKDEVNLMIKVTDSGIGIEQDQQEKIFKSFTQYNGRKDRSHEGTGLGLAIVNGLLKKLNGKIELSSQSGKGSTFKISFFNVQIGNNIEISEQTKEPDVKFRLKPCSIMIVDDIEYNIKVLKAQINSDKVKYLEAKDGNIALAILQVERPDIIFLDLRMPGMDGFELVKMIKGDNNLKNIPVIAFSASTIKNRKELIADLFDDYLTKPVLKKKLDSILLRYIPNSIEYQNERAVEERVLGQEVCKENLQNIDHIVSVLENEFQPKWEGIKDNLIIYEIEIFKKELSEFALKEKCSLLTLFCDELDLGLQAFDIEMIGKKIGEFPTIKAQLEQLSENRK